jgi:hypothetical protein
VNPLYITSLPANYSLRIIKTASCSYACASGNSGKASKCNGTGTTIGKRMINNALSKMIYVFRSNTSFKVCYCNPSNPTVSA